jgi:hypothetical protein
MDKETVLNLHTQWNTIQTEKKWNSFAFATTWMELEIIMSRENELGIERQILYELIHGWNL